MSRYKLDFYEFVGCVVFQDTRYAEDQKNPETYLTANEACDLLNELTAKLESVEADAMEAVKKYADATDRQETVLMETQAKLEAAEKRIADAPHALFCAHNVTPHPRSADCDCWKSPGG